MKIYKAAETCLLMYFRTIKFLKPVLQIREALSLVCFLGFRLNTLSFMDISI